MDTRVEKYLNTNIKDIITEFNGVQDALDAFNIGCAPCNLGTCKLKDVVGIHNLSVEDEKTLFTQIFSIIYPNQTLEIPSLAKERKPMGTSTSLTPPMRLLVEEHKLIKRVLALVPEIYQQLDLSMAEHRQLIIDITDFIKNYADKYHHAKEEEILFKGFDESLDIIQVMISDHVLSRSFVANMLVAVNTQNTQLGIDNLNNYANLLTEHITKEDTILYPWMDSNLSTKQIGEMYAAFLKINNDTPELQSHYEQLVLKLEEKFK